MNTYELKGQEYPVTGSVWSQSRQSYVPLVDIPMMSDERWRELAKKYPVRREA